ncbi:MAG: hypothetical protein IJS08_01005, partial [Victivallales bacterium]|nr:hypothetical protein [Victivallales bacterium]
SRPFIPTFYPDLLSRPFIPTFYPDLLSRPFIPTFYPDLLSRPFRPDSDEWFQVMLAIIFFLCDFDLLLSKAMANH